MKTKKYWILGLVLSVCLVWVIPVNVLSITQNEERQIEMFGDSTLKGLKGIRLHVFIFDMSKKENGLLEAQNWEQELRTEAELEIRKNGIEVLSIEYAKNPNVPVLFVTIETIAMRVLVDDLDGYIYAIRVSTGLYEKIFLLREPIKAICQIWPNMFPRTSELSLAGQYKVKQAIKDKMNGQINEFCNDYLAANPKQSSPSTNK